jgi:two-component system, cell cycle response regulator
MQSPMKILLADDDTVTRVVLGGLLSRWGFDVVMARDGMEAARVLERDDAPNLAVIDWMMPGMNGIDLCRRIRDEKRPRYVYVLLLTGNCGKEDILTGFEAGADDYLVKPCAPEELNARLRTGKRIVELQDALRAQATRDALTQAWNRRGVLELLGRELKRAERQCATTTLIMADVDQFKRINDTYGHPAGDAVLAEVAGRLMSPLRPYDGVGRYGGEEFLIVVPGCTPEDAPQIGERLRLAVATEPVCPPGAMIPVTASFGVAVGAQGVRPEALIKAADDALYRAKKGGRNRVELATPLDPAHAEAPASWPRSRASERRGVRRWTGARSTALAEGTRPTMTPPRERR